MKSKPRHSLFGLLPDPIPSIDTRASGGIGRRAGFRCLCPSGCEGSSPSSRTIFQQVDAKSKNFKLLLSSLIVLCSFLLATHLQAQENTTNAINEELSLFGPDFNGDGYGDIVIGATGERFGDAIRTGAVTILFGDANKLFSESILLHQGMLTIAGDNDPNDRFGSRTTFGDFNGDGLDDLVITAPQKDVNGIEDVGMMWVLPGLSQGMGIINSAKSFDLSMFIANEDISAKDHWGEMIVSGDFNGDGYEDIAISSPNANTCDDDTDVLIVYLYGPSSQMCNKENAGLIVMLYGSETGLDSNNYQVINQGIKGIPDTSEINDMWGSSLAEGDFNGDQISDLAVGAPGEKYGFLPSSGAVTIIYGSDEGLNPKTSKRFHQDTHGIPGRNEENDQWGATLIADDFSEDGIDDLIVGSPNESIGEKQQSGSITILYGSREGISSQKSTRIHQGSFGIQDSNEAFDRWGSVLTTGDFNGDSKIDLVIGAPAEGSGTFLRTGAITIIPGTAGLLTSREAKTIHQDQIPSNLDISHADHWGDALGSVDVNGDGKTDLLVASSAKSIGTQFDSGTITLLWGTKNGIVPENSNYLDQNISRIPDDNKSMDYWGRLGTSSELTLERPPLGLITPAGINVVVMVELPQTTNSSLAQYIVRTPCGRSQRAIGGELIKDIQIVIDPGHGGIDGGAGYFGLREHSVNLTVSEALKTELTARGINSFLVRSSNYHIPLASRGLYADHLQADAMVSIHHNAPTIAPSRHPGTEAFVQSNSNNSSRLGTLVYESVYEALDKFSWISWTSQYDAGVIRVLNNRGTDTYGMLSRPRTPTTLVELAYLANKAEANLIKSPEYLPAVSVAMADAVEEYLTKPSEGSYPSSLRNFTAANAPGYNVCRDPDLGSPLFFDFEEDVLREALFANE